MSESPPTTEAAVLVIDRLARAVFTWVRHEVMQQRFCGVVLTDPEQCALAAGFIAGLRTRIGLADSEASLLAYAYALMSGERKQAPELAEKLLARESALAFSCSGYLNGLQSARNLLGDLHAGPASSKSDSPSVAGRDIPV